MKRVGFFREANGIVLELPDDAVPYEEFDFEPYFDESRNDEELQKTWRIFTKVKDVLKNRLPRENASWRFWVKERKKAGGIALTEVYQAKNLSELENCDLNLDASLKKAEADTDKIVGDVVGGMQTQFLEENEKVAVRAKVDRTGTLLDISSRQSIAEDAVVDIFAWIQNAVQQAEEVSGGAGASDPGACAVVAVAVGQLVALEHSAVGAKRRDKEGALRRGAPGSPESACPVEVREMLAPYAPAMTLGRREEYEDEFGLAN